MCLAKNVQSTREKEKERIDFRLWSERKTIFFVLIDPNGSSCRDDVFREKTKSFTRIHRKEINFNAVISASTKYTLNAAGAGMSMNLRRKR
jgi:flagellar biosynthesis GTPase FlhF